VNRPPYRQARVLATHVLVNDDGKVVMFRYWGSPWLRSRLRQDVPCSSCSSPLEKGQYAHRPIDNSLFRADRLCIECVQKLCQLEGISP